MQKIVIDDINWNKRVSTLVVLCVCLLIESNDGVGFRQFANKCDLDDRHKYCHQCLYYIPVVVEVDPCQYGLECLKVNEGESFESIEQELKVSHQLTPL